MVTLCGTIIASTATNNSSNNIRQVSMEIFQKENKISLAKCKQYISHLEAIRPTNPSNVLQFLAIVAVITVVVVVDAVAVVAVVDVVTLAAITAAIISETMTDSDRKNKLQRSFTTPLEIDLQHHQQSNINNSRRSNICDNTSMSLSRPLVTKAAVPIPLNQFSLSTSFCSPTSKVERERKRNL